MTYDVEIRNILEKEILSSLLNNSELFFNKKHALKQDDFFFSEHKLIFSAILKSIDKFNVVNLSTVRESIKNVSKEGLSTNDVITLMSNYKSFRGSLFDKHCEMLFEYNICDELALLANQIKSYKKQNVEDFEGRLNSWKAELSAIGSTINSDVSLQDSIDEAVSVIIDRINNKSSIMGVDAGTEMINDFTSGWLQPDLILLAGRPGMGKSAYVIHNLKKNAFNNESAALFSYEMPKQQIFERIVAAMTGINSKKMLKGDLTSEEFVKVKDAFSRVKQFPVHIIDQPLNLSSLLNKIRYLHSKNKIKIAYIDYVQLIENDIDVTTNDDIRIGGISKRLKLLSMELKIPIVLLSQLSRGVELRKDKKPISSDLRGSGNLEQDADVIGFFYRPSYYDLEVTNLPLSKEQTQYYCQIIFTKGRRIGTKEINLFYNQKINFFDDWKDNHENPF